MFLSSITIFFLTWGITCLGIGMGAIYPRFHFTHPAHIFSGWEGALYMILAMIFIGAVVLMEAWPFYRFSAASFGHHPLTVFEWAGIFLSLGGLTLLNSWVIVAPMRLGLKKIAERDFS